MPFLSEMEADTGFIPVSTAKEKGAEFAAQYAGASPFPHIVLDDFLPPEILETCLAEFPKGEVSDAVTYDRAQERFKSQFNPDALSQRVRTLFYSFNSRPFIRVLENITGIRGLTPDPYFLGAGFHEITQGGSLSVHTDFNHHKPLNLERRINVLIYLNKDWSDDYGGQLELWSGNMTEKVQSIVPAFNRCVIFNTTSESNHGNPQPVNHPANISRKSIALYYYTSTWGATKREHTTQFRTRSGTADKVDWQIKATELVRDVTPPILLRSLSAMRKPARERR